MDEEKKRPEPPKDENGNPLPAPDGHRPPPPHGGKRPPEPPKDENGNPLLPPDGHRPPHPPRKPEDAAEV